MLIKKKHSVLSLLLCLLLFMNTYSDMYYAATPLDNDLMESNSTEHNNTEELIQIIDDSHSTNSHDEKDVDPASYEFYLIFEKRIYEIGESIFLSFVLKCDSTIESITSESQGFSEIQFPSYSQHTIKAVIQNMDDSGCLKYTVYVTLLNDVTLESSVYAIIENDKIYLSSNSFLGARDLYYAELCSEGVYLQEDEPHRFLGEAVSSITEKSYFIEELPEDPKSITSNDTFISGTIQWKDDWGNWHPLQFSKVIVYDKYGLINTELGTVFTDQNGNYTLGFINRAGGCNLFIKIYPIGENSIVKTAANNDYIWISNVTQNVPTGLTTVINVNIDMSDDIGRAFQVSQAVIIAAKYTKAMSGNNLSNVTVRYPIEPTEGSKCYYSSNVIYIIGDRENDAIYSGQKLHSYASWDMIMHEYNHHVQDKLNLTDNPGGWHYVDKNMYKHYMSHHGGAAEGSCYDVSGNITCAHPSASQAKEKAIKIAYAESWASIIGGMGQLYAIGNWNLNSNIRTVGDSNYNAYNGVSFNYNTPYYSGPGEYVSEVVEGAIDGILWDFFDNDTMESHDLLSMNHNQFWAISTQNNAKTLSEFVQSFYQSNGINNISQAGQILSYFKVSTTAPTMTNASSVSQSVPPSFSWMPQGGMDVLPNNRFVLIAYDSAHSELFRTQQLTNSSYTLTTEQWNSVLFNDGLYYYIAIAAEQTDSPVTGQYLSELVVYQKPTPPTISQNISIPSNSRYTEIIAGYQPGQYIDYYVTFSTGGTKLFQTFGPKDTKLFLYDANSILLSSDDDSGYSSNALLSVNAIAGVTYKIRVKYFLPAVGGKIKLSIVSTWPFASYEEIYSLVNYTQGLTWTLSQNNVSLLTYKYSSTMDHTLHVSSDLDTFLYIIDPRSTDMVFPALTVLPDLTKWLACLYNDNINGNTNTNSQIKKTFAADVPYLVIVSAYDPSLSTSTGSYYLSVLD